MVFLHAFGGVFSLIAVVLLGYFLSSRNWFDAATVRLLPKLITNVCLPPFLALTILQSFILEDLAHLLPAVGAPFVIIALMFGMAWLLAKAMHVSRRHFGLFCSSISNSNTIFIGIPINMALFGPDAVGYVLFYYFSSTFFFWTVGNFFISRDENASGESSGKARKFSWKKIISPPMMGFLCGLFLLLLGVRLPQFIITPVQQVGQLTTPLALIFIGIILQQTGLRNMRPDRDMTIALIGRLIACPVFAMLILPWFGLPAIMNNVYIIQSGLPVLMQVSILSAYYDTDPAFGTEIVALSTILCIFTIPCLMSLL